MISRTCRGVRRVLLQAVLVLVAVAIGCSHAQAGAPGSPAGEKLTLGVASLTPTLVWIFWAKDAGVFRAQGLDIDFVFFSSSTDAIQALVARRISAVIGIGGPGPAYAVLAGADLVWTAELLGTMPYVLMVSPDIVDASQLRGKRLATNKLGSSVDFATRFAAAKLGLDPRRDITVLQIGDQAARLAALVAGSIDGTVVSPPSTVVARKLGFRQLVDLSRMGLKYPHESLVVDRAMIRDRPDALRGLLKTAVLGVHHFKTNRADGIELIRRHLKVEDGEALAEAYEFFSRLIQRKPYLEPEAVQLVLNEIEATQPGARARKPDDFVDMRFVRELDESGFIDRLYR